MRKINFKILNNFIKNDIILFYKLNIKIIIKNIFDKDN